MSRSHRHTPIFGNTCKDSDRAYKAAEHRRERRAVREAIAGADDVPSPKAYGSPNKSAKDGKHYWGRAGAKDMRK